MYTIKSTKFKHWEHCEIALMTVKSKTMIKLLLAITI